MIPLEWGHLFLAFDKHIGIKLLYLEYAFLYFLALYIRHVEVFFTS